MKSTNLNLDAPGAAEALSSAYALLRRWAKEAKQGTVEHAGDQHEEPVASNEALCPISDTMRRKDKQ